MQADSAQETCLDAAQETPEARRLDLLAQLAGADIRHVLSLLPVGLCYVDPDCMEIALANESAASILEAPNAQVLAGQSVFRFVPPGRHQQVRDYLCGLAEAMPLPQFLPEPLLSASGRQIELEIAGSLLRLGGRSIIQLAFQEITARSRAEAALRESVALFRSLTETTDAAIYLFRGAHYLYVNPAACRITGYTSDELAAMPFWEIVHPDYREVVRNRGFARQQGHEVESNYEVAIVTKTGGTRWLQFAGHLIEYQGQPAGLGTAIDITARKEVEQALQQSEARFRTLTHVSPASISIHVDDRLIYANPATVSMTGYSIEELRAADFWSILHPDSLETMRQAYDRMGRGEAVSNLKLQIIAKDGSTKWVEINWSPFDLSGKLAWVITGYDVTALVEAEQALRVYARRLETLSAIDRLGLLGLSRQEIAEAALHRIRTLIQCDRASIVEVDAPTKSHIMIAVSPPGNTAISPGRRFKLTHWQKVHDDLRHGEHYVADIDALPTLSALQKEIRAEGIRSYVAVSLLAQQKLVGVLNLGSLAPHAFDDAARSAVREAAGRLAVVLYNAHLFDALASSRQRQEELSRRLERLQEAERQAIARELHDEFGQTLTALSIHLQLALHSDSQEQARHLVDTQRLVQELADRVRRMSLHLRPPMLDDLGLLPTLLWYFDRVAQQYQLHVDFEHHGLERRFEAEIETAVFRIVQEALTNVARHAHTATASVHLWADGSTISAQIEDKGQGFDPDLVLNRNSSSGLRGMRERARLLGGTLVIDAHPGEGACLTVLLPLQLTQPPARGADGL
jgi:PAS domain S-box-containing protein